MIVIDSGVLVGFLVESDSFRRSAIRKFSEWQDQQESFIAPLFIQSEVTAVIRRAVYEGRTSHAEGLLAIDAVMSFDLQLYHDDELLRSAFILARDFGLPRSYDTQFIALAQRFDCDFWTTDKKLYLAVVARFPRIHLLGEIP